MNVKLKLAAYAVLVILVAWFGWAFHSNYTTVARESAQADIGSTNDTPVVAATNPPDNSTNTVATNTTAVSTNIVPSKPAPSAQPSIESARGSTIGYLIALVASIVALGLLLAYDATQFLGGRAVDFLYDTKGEGMRDPEYERAEQVWANGKFLEAIQLMRDYLKKHPREQYVALRIAEIYEKDLKNLLAAALELEEVLKQKLTPDRWGWTAIHLCNLYSKLGQQDKTRALLDRIVTEYPQTAAAKKARSRLGLAEPEEAEEVIAPQEEAAPEPAPVEEPPAPESNLPPGFRPKK